MITWFDVPKEGMSPGSKAIIPTGNIELTENGEGIDVSTYATATVNVEGGGGSSDFSTAEVTVNLTLDDSTTIASAFVNDVFLNFPDENFGYVGESLQVTNNKVVVILYNNYAEIGGLSASNTSDNYYVLGENVPTASGGVAFDSELGVFIVTGDGTITAVLSAE